MNRLLKLLGYRDRIYRGDEFSVRIKPGVRELVSVIHMRDGNSLDLQGERIGKKWEGIEVRMPQEVEPGRISQIARDLEAAFQAMGYGYLITASAGTDVVPETERKAAIAELLEMGYEIEVSTDRRQIRQKRIVGTTVPDLETAKKQASRMMSLLQAVHGTRHRLVILAKSKEF